jgi:hypothetical protein
MFAEVIERAEVRSDWTLRDTIINNWASTSSFQLFVGHKGDAENFRCEIFATIRPLGTVLSWMRPAKKIGQLVPIHVFVDTSRSIAITILLLL